MDAKHLIDLHTSVAQYLRVALEDDVVDPKVLDAAIRFLKDNGINTDFKMTDEISEKEKTQASVLAALPKFSPSKAEEDAA